MYEAYFNGTARYELYNIVKSSGCKKPCHYKKYRFVGGKLKSPFQSDHFTISLASVSVYTDHEKEQLIYPPASLIAEFGGTLGLFLGFSFMTLWDEMGRLCSMKNFW